jgi:hypothetical protein
VEQPDGVEEQALAAGINVIGEVGLACLLGVSQGHDHARGLVVIGAAQRSQPLLHLAAHLFLRVSKQHRQLVVIFFQRAGSERLAVFLEDKIYAKHCYPHFYGKVKEKIDKTKKEEYILTKNK